MSINSKLLLSVFLYLVFALDAGAQPKVPFSLSHVPTDALSWTADDKTLEISEYNQANPPSLDFPPDFKGKNCLINEIKCGSGISVRLIFEKNGEILKPKAYHLSYWIEGSKKSYNIQVLPTNVIQLLIQGKSNILDPIIFNAVIGPVIRAIYLYLVQKVN